jgi:methylenetetrahydrofolate reductase (NADPH)
MKHVSFEVFPSENLKLDLIPGDWKLAITCTSEELQPTLDLYAKIGSPHTPHLSAALVESEEHLQKLRAIYTDRIFLIGGDLQPRGPFSRSATLIPHFTHCREIGVASYPEGHPSYATETLGDEILLDKQRLGATYAATQLCFDPQKIVDWSRRIRDRGITLPIYCGIAPPISAVKLTQFAIRCGVNTSLNFIKKMSIRDAAKMAASYDPRPLMEAVVDSVDGFHIYTFNAIKTTREWAEGTPWLSELAER